MAIIFDFDGTLVDSRQRIFASADQAFSDYGPGRPSNAEVLKTIGLKPVDMMSRLLPDAPQHVRESIAERYRNHSLKMSRTQTDHETPFPGVSDLFETLLQRNVPTGLATGKSRQGLEYSLQTLGWQSFFQSTRTADDGPGKPHPHILQEVVRDLGVEGHHSLYVGDTVFDMEMAVAAGVRPIGVSWGYHSEDELLQAGASRVLTSWNDLLSVMN